MTSEHGVGELTEEIFWNEQDGLSLSWQVFTRVRTKLTELHCLKSVHVFVYEFHIDFEKNANILQMVVVFLEVFMSFFLTQCLYGQFMCIFQSLKSLTVFSFCHVLCLLKATENNVMFYQILQSRYIF